MKKYGAMLQIGVSFETRGEIFDLISKFRQFLDESVPVENFDFQDIKLVFCAGELDSWGDPK